MQYGWRLLECLIAAQVRVYLLISPAAQVVSKLELGVTIPAQPLVAQQFFSDHCRAAPGQLRVFGRQQWTAPVASGSHAPDAMVICPCTVATLASVAAGLSDDLINRAADVMLKEQRKLIMVLRETPLSVIHLENMLRLARAGAVIMPASPGFYGQPQTVNDLVDFIVARVLDHLQVAHSLLPRWGDESPPAAID
ncbi:flavin prenyltransferase UbiX [Thiospirillum jenense]